MKIVLSFYLLFHIAAGFAQEQLLYISTASGNFDIYKLDLESGKSTRLTDNPGWDWSPKYIKSDGLIFYYSTDTIKNFTYKLMDLDGNEKEIWLPEGENMLPSPDGRYFSFTKKYGDHQYIYLFETTSKSVKKVVAERSYNGRVCWKRDGSGFAFISDRDGNNEIYYYDLTSGYEKRLTRDTLRQKYLAWSPDGNNLVYSNELTDTTNELRILKIDTGEVVELTGNNYTNSELTWSADGNYIAFHSKRAEGDQIYFLEISSGKLRQITKDDAYHGEPEWIMN